MSTEANAEIRALRARLAKLDERMEAETAFSRQVNAAFRNRGRGRQITSPTGEESADVGAAPDEADSSPTDMNVLIRQAAGRNTQETEK